VDQCVTNSRPVRRKKLAVEEKIRPPGHFHSFDGICDLDTEIIFVYVSGENIIFIGLSKNYREQKVKIYSLEVPPLFGTFCTKSAQIRPQICPAAPLFFSSCCCTIGQLATLEWIRMRIQSPNSWT
jgi:hypothetical protein